MNEREKKEAEKKSVDKFFLIVMINDVSVKRYPRCISNFLLSGFRNIRQARVYVLYSYVYAPGTTSTNTHPKQSVHAPTLLILKLSMHFES
jgi:hypothetical protein